MRTIIKNYKEQRNLRISGIFLNNIISNSKYNTNNDNTNDVAYKLERIQSSLTNQSNDILRLKNNKFLLLTKNHTSEDINNNIKSYGNTNVNNANTNDNLKENLDDQKYSGVSQRDCRNKEHAVISEGSQNLKKKIYM